MNDLEKKELTDILSTIEKRCIEMINLNDSRSTIELVATEAIIMFELHVINSAVERYKKTTAQNTENVVEFRKKE